MVHPHLRRATILDTYPVCPQDRAVGRRPPAALSRVLWHQRITAVRSTLPLHDKMIRPLIDTLARAA